LSIPLQLGIFAVLSFVALYGGRRWLKANPITTTDPHLNQRAGRLVGEVLTVTKAIEDGRGRAKVGDGEWPVRGPDVAEGAKVRVVSAEGGVLVVELA
jgi:membrane protein implicated in regulation of membrane protease activity